MNAKKGDMLIMIRRKILFALILVLSFTASAWGDKTLTVGGTINDPSNDVYVSITDALESADILAGEDDAYADVIIAFSSSTYNVTNRDNGSVTLSGRNNLTSVTIGDGTSVTITHPHFIISDTGTFAFNGVTLTGSTTGAVSISSGTVGFDSVTFSDNTTGGALTVSGGSAEFSECTFSGNTASSNGGAISITGGSVTVDGSKFTENSASGSGGAIYAASGATLSFTGTNTFTDNNNAATGGAIYTQVASVTFENATFTGNTATSGSGGAIYSEGVLTFSGAAVFESNTATSGNGGAIYTAGNTTFSSTANFTENTATGGNGGAIYTTGTLDLTGAADFATNTAATSGGAIYTTGSTATFGGAVTFTGNTATNGSGGAVYTSGALVFNGTSETKFDSNTAKTYGGAIYATSSKSDANFSAASVTFNKNEAGIGGAVHSAGTLEFSDEATFTSNTATSSDAGAIYTTGTLTFSDTATFTSNTAEANAGAIYVAGGTTTFSGAATFSTNHAATDGGAVYVASGTLEAGDAALTFTGNYSDSYDSSSSESSPVEGSGGAICIKGGTVNLGDVKINDHKATYGGAIYIEGGNLKITGTADFGTDTANNAYDGGALYIAGGTTAFEGDTVTFTKNAAQNDGGALFVDSDALSTSLSFSSSTSVTFTKNTANADKGSLGNGGAIYWGASATNFANAFGSASSVTFRDNEVLFPSSSTETVTFGTTYGNGGAIYCAGDGTLTIDDSTNYTFYNNTAASNGGAIFTVNAHIVIKNVEIADLNTATNGGGGFAATSSSDITADNSSFTAQVAEFGGALYAESMTITSCDFTENTSGSGGGGAIATFYKNETGKVTITESTFTQNETEGRGGAILARTANFTVTNTFFGTNTAENNGGAIDVGGESSTTIQQSTFANNKAVQNSGGAIYADGKVEIEANNGKRASKNLGRCYFVSNTAKVSGGAIHYDQRNNNGEFIVQGSLFEKNTANDSSGGAISVLSDLAQIESCTFDQNSAGAAVNNSAGGYGGGAVFVFISGQNVRAGREAGLIRNCVFTQNEVNGAGTESNGGAVSLLGTVTVTSCTFSINNKVANYGGGIFVGKNATLIISATIAVGNNAKNGNDIYKGDGATITTGGYNRVGIYGTGGNNTGWGTDVGVESDRENTTWTKADFFGSNVLADNIRSDSIPPTVGSTVGNIDTKRLPSLMLNEAESLPLADRATTVIPFILRSSFPQYDIRGVDRQELGTDLDIGAVFFDGTRKSTGDDENSYYSIASIKISGIPNSMKAIGETASLLAVIRYTNGRSAFAGNGTNQEKVTWRSSDENIIKFTGDGVITAMGKEGTAYITVTTQRTKQDGTYASDRQAVTVTPKESILNLGTDFLKNFEKFLEQTYEYDMSVAMADPNTSVISSAAFQSTFKNKWGTSPSAILDMSEVYPDFSLKNASAYKANTTLYLAAAQAQRPGINVNFPERTDGDLLPLTYSWTLKGADIKYLLGEDYQLGDADAKLAADLFSVMSINLTTANNKNINVVNADNAGTLFSSKALVLSKADSNNGVHIDLTAYIAHVDGGTGTQIVNNLLIVPDNLDYDEILDGTMWLAYGTSSSNNNNNNNKGGNNNSDGNSDSNSNSGGGGGGGGCNSLALGLVAAGLLFALKRK